MNMTSSDMKETLIGLKDIITLEMQKVINRLYICEAEDCKRSYLRTRKASRFCCPRCQARVGTRQMRAKRKATAPWPTTTK